ncbi:DUF2478 domain-containing protein [Labrenzia sp. 011]|uniref:DUF2478 domain-containing protein n=1 Tax=Labrenzia sp. 011 TaxID=2171494 RepID=UPI000D50AB78|nr:DUF2478 domain-containing protein [Labrenzia sp. 011]PVB62352.1 hypothetical protein DCO57_06190 [Labrenzia sp. 011]
MTETTPICAAVLTTRGSAVDVLLQDVCETLRRNGHHVSGVLQRQAEAVDTCCADMGLELLSTGERIEISQPLGKASRGCRLDPRGLAEITARLMRELDAFPDLLVLNRFGKGEQDGQGFRQLIAAAVERNIPVLTAVRPPYLEDWRSFTGTLSVELPENTAGILRWCAAVVEAPLARAAHG